MWNSSSGSWSSSCSGYNCWCYCCRSFCLIANAETLSDGNYVFKYDISNGNYSVSLTNLGADRYANINIVIYNSAGEYVNSIGDSGILKRGATLSVSGHLLSGYSVSIDAVIYMGTSSHGSLLSEWKILLGGM